MTSHYPLFIKLKFPGNAMSFNLAILDVAKYELVDTSEKIDRLLFYLPETEAYNAGFDECHYNSTLLVANISSLVWMYVLNLAGVFLLVLCIIMANKKSCRPALANSKLRNYFLCNGLIRIFMETFFELAMVSLVNIHTADWNTPFFGVKLSNNLTIISLILISVIPLWLIVLYCRNFKILGEVRFSSRYGAGYEGLNLAKKVSPKSILGIPVFYFGRRILFAVSAVYLEQNLLAQLAIQVLVSFMVLGYLLHFKSIYESL